MTPATEDDDGRRRAALIAGRVRHLDLRRVLSTGDPAAAATARIVAASLGVPAVERRDLGVDLAAALDAALAQHDADELVVAGADAIAAEVAVRSRIDAPLLRSHLGRPALVLVSWPDTILRVEPEVR